VVPDWEGGSAGAAVRPEELLVEESAAFLSGHLAEVASPSRPSSPWVWTNLLAHGSEDELRAERSRTPENLWEAARVRLAAGVLELAKTSGPLTDVQRELLVPLELDLASDPKAAQWEPQRLVVQVSDALDRYRRARRRSERPGGRPMDGEEPDGA
jgi:hypothetical protein